VPPARTEKVVSEHLSRSLEDYLETILFLIRRRRVARVRDIAKRLNVGMPAVTAALKTLSKRELVNYDPYQVVTLTDPGREVAEEISQRHFLLRQFLTDVLGLDGESADANACRMEHAVDEDLLQRLQEFMRFIHECPRAGSSLVENFRKYCRQRPDLDRCRECISAILQDTAARAAREEVSP